MRVEKNQIRLFIGLAAFCAPIIFVLAAAAQTPVTETVLAMMDQVATVTMR